MTDPITVPAPPATVEVVAMKVAEQVMSDMYRRISELEARLAQAEREANEAEQVSGTACLDGTAFTEVAQELLQRAEELRASARTLADGEGASRAPGDARILQLPRTPADLPRDTHG